MRRQQIDEFIDWRCDPDRQGSLKDWAEAHGVPYDTVLGWNSKDPSIRSIIENRLGEYNASPERMQKIIEAMWDKAQNGDTRAAQLYLAYVERISPMKRMEDPVLPAAQLSDEELRAALADALG